MRLAIIADIHGNVLALEAVLEDLAGRKPDAVVNLGDCVSGPLWPRQTLDLLMEKKFPTVRGNHDRWVADANFSSLGPSDVFARRELDGPCTAGLGALPTPLGL